MDAAIAGFVVEVGAGAFGVEIEVVEIGGNGLVRFEVKVAAADGYDEVEDGGGCCGCGRDSECDR